MQVKRSWRGTDQLASPLARVLLDLPRGWTDSPRESAIVTSLLMFAPVVEAMRAKDGLERGRFVLDVRLFKDVYRACPPSFRPALLASPPAKYLPPGVFRSMFLQTYRRDDLHSEEKARMASTLEAFLTRHSRLAPQYESVILEMLRCETFALTLRGLSMTGRFLRQIEPGDLARIQSKLASKNVALRGAALQAVRSLMGRSEEVDPGVLAFCTSDSLMRRLRRLAEADSDPVNRSQATGMLRTHRRRRLPVTAARR